VPFPVWLIRTHAVFWTMLSCPSGPKASGLPVASHSRHLRDPGAVRWSVGCDARLSRVELWAVNKALLGTAIPGHARQLLAISAATHRGTRVGAHALGLALYGVGGLRLRYSGTTASSFRPCAVRASPSGVVPGASGSSPPPPARRGPGRAAAHRRAGDTGARRACHGRGRP
jgi:hypothetical protein